jgi:DNA-binding transcriptional regulator YhcF (GntR family)
MKKIEFVFEEILYNVLEKKNNRLTQLQLAKELNISLSTVNLALRHLRKMNAVDVNQRSFTVIDPRKILFYWASIRNPEKDIIYKTRVELPVRNIEANMPRGITFGAYSAYKFRFKDVPADYSEVYVYSEEECFEEDIKKRFPFSKNEPNLFVLKKDTNMKRYGELTTIARTFVDLWNISTWYAKDFVKELEVKIDGLLE